MQKFFAKDAHWTAPIIGVVLGVGIVYALLYVTVCLIQFAVHGIWGYELPFWPTLAAWVLIGTLAKAAGRE